MRIRTMSNRFVAILALMTLPLSACHKDDPPPDSSSNPPPKIPPVQTQKKCRLNGIQPGYLTINFESNFTLCPVPAGTEMLYSVADVVNIDDLKLQPAGTKLPMCGGQTQPSGWQIDTGDQTYSLNCNPSPDEVTPPWAVTIYKLPN